MGLKGSLGSPRLHTPALLHFCFTVLNLMNKVHKRENKIHISSDVAP